MGTYKNTYKNDTEDVYLTDLLFRQNNKVIVLNENEDLRNNETLLNSVKLRQKDNDN